MDSNKEKEILAFWAREKIFEKSLAERKGRKKFVFYEGPPYANGLPGIHHLEARAFKDLVARYKTMRGFFVPRKAGWDTHGLPTEMSVEKKLGIKTKREIEEKIGIERFVQAARADVFAYKKEWEDFTRRMGYWLDFENAYVTMDNAYMEKLWGILKTIWRKKLLYDDFKVLPWCTRCGTALSSHELALGYKKVIDKAITVKFELIGEPGTCVLAWTTTPWTLPGNVALAVKRDTLYIQFKTTGSDSKKYIVAKDSASRVFNIQDGRIYKRFTYDGKEYAYNSEFRGNRLIGRSYKPIFDIPDLRSPTSYKIYPADFVSASEGTGIVHIAVMYGEDDYELGKKIDLPRFHTVDETGRFIKTLGEGLGGRYVKDHETETLIGEILKKKNLFFKEESYEHEYPFCWRCDSPLLYYARHGWWIAMTTLRSKLLKNNKQINWFPPYLKEGRFGEWLREVKDWAISRERYWGLPLPIWECPSCRHHEIIGSLADLDKKSFDTTRTIFFMRHGEADHNVNGMTAPATPAYDVNDHLTEHGRSHVAQSAKKLKKTGIDIVVASPLARAQETAKIVAGILKVPIATHDKLYDYDVGDWHDKSIEEIDHLLPIERRFEEPMPGGESLRNVRIRMMNSLREILKKYPDKTILLISHGDPLWVLNAGLEGIEEKKYKDKWYPKTGEVKKITLHNWPYSPSRGELDVHRPYIDEISLKCSQCGSKAKRIKEVADVWFDSGSMPFAAGVDYPADFICEAIDQTRGWFYTLLAVATALGKKAPYKNVLTLELVLDEKGKKMSKSRGNAVEPNALMEKYSADAARWYFFTINQPWNPKLFSENDVKKAKQKFLDILENSFNFYRTHALKKLRPLDHKPSHVLDRWIFTKLNWTKSIVINRLDSYDIVDAARALEDFVGNDLSRWYIQCSRERFKKDDKKTAEAIAVLGCVLRETAKLFAPFAPFIAEHLYQELNGIKQSVHLESFPQAMNFDKNLMQSMGNARRIVSLALEERAKFGIKVRQPLSTLKISLESGSIFRRTKLKEEFLDIIKARVNVKRVEFSDDIEGEILLDAVITPELKEEGEIRELTRLIQDARKKAGLKPGEQGSLKIEIQAELAETAKRKKEMLMKETKTDFNV